uniref:Glabrous enhancer-binding protein-like DBD domain-containing protein n=1 Tax=Oryza punctata TaxID=4537 RepID=A0A0E0LYF5_ORYPU
MATSRRRAAHPGSASAIPSSSSPADELPGRGRDAQGAERLEVEGSVPAGEKAKATKKPVAFARVWSEADELRILECLAAHVKKHGAPPSRSQLPEVLAGRGLDKEEFTVSEIYEKVRRLRSKYDKMLSGPRPVPGDIGRNRFELSTAIWGNGNPIAPPPTGTRGRRDLQELRALYPCLVDAVERISASECGGDVPKMGLAFIDDGTAVRMNALVKKQRVLELKSMLKLDSMRKEVMRTLLNIMD